MSPPILLDGIISRLSVLCAFVLSFSPPLRFVGIVGREFPGDTFLGISGTILRDYSYSPAGNLSGPNTVTQKIVRIVVSI